MPAPHSMCQRAVDYFSIAPIARRVARSRYRSIIHLWRRPANNGRFHGISWRLLYSITNLRRGRHATGNFRETRLPNEPWILQDMSERGLLLLNGITARFHRSEKSLSARTVTEDNSIRLECDSRDDERNEIPPFLSSIVFLKCPRRAKFKRFDSEYFFSRREDGPEIKSTSR